MLQKRTQITPLSQPKCALKIAPMQLLISFSWDGKKKKEQDSATQICNYWVIHWPSFKWCRTARIQYHALRSVLEYKLKVLNRPNLANPLETPHLPASYTGSASIIQQRQQWRAAEKLTFLSRFHSLRQQKLQKNKSPTMSADTGVPPRCSSSFHWGRRIPHCHNKPLAAAEPADGKGREERGNSSSLHGWAHLWNKCHSSRLHPELPPPPLPLLPSLLLWPHLPVWPRPLLSCTQANWLLQQHTPFHPPH